MKYGSMARHIMGNRRRVGVQMVDNAIATANESNRCICPLCDGTGETLIFIGFIGEREKGVCPRCNGTGIVHNYRQED